MGDEPPSEWNESVPAEQVVDNLMKTLDSMDDVQSLDILEHLLANSPTVEDSEDAYYISYLTLSKKFLEIHRESKRIEKIFEKSFEEMDAEEVPPKAHPERIKSMTVNKAKKKELSEDVILFFSLAQEVIVHLSKTLCEITLKEPDPLSFNQDRTSSDWASDIQSKIQDYDDMEKVANERLCQPQREKYLYYTETIGETLHNDLIHIRRNLRNNLMHDVQERKTLDSFSDIESELLKCVGAINKLSKLADGEIAIKVSRADDGSHIITEDSS